MNKSSFRFLQKVTLVSTLFLYGVPASQADTLEVLESQSPIDIRSDSTYYGKLPSLNFELSSDTPLTVINNGSPHHESTIRANVNPGEGTLKVAGREWDLVQFHFHTPSEHLINGQATPMEMHLVFSDAEDLLVVGREIKQGLFDNRALKPMFSQLPQTTEETLHIDHFNLNHLLPNYLGSFRYSGSLTTPPFTEGVSWIELAKPLYLSERQIDAFESLFPDGNSREVQDLNGRIVLTDVPGFVDTHEHHDVDWLLPELGVHVGATGDDSKLAASVPEPETYAMLLAGLGLLGFVARRRQS
jgi:carbonic anhydrase